MKCQLTIAILLLIGLAACGEKSAPEPVATVEDVAPEAESQAAAPVGLPRTASPEGARVFFITPSDGATISGPVAIEFGIEGMQVAKAGDNQPHSGHHHLLIDTAVPDLGLPIPADANHIHFGDGSTSTAITLEPGEHTLQMLLGDHLHIPHEPPLVSEVITITVE